MTHRIRLSRRQFLRSAALGGAAFASGMLAACGASPTTPTGQAPTTAPAPVSGEPTKIRALMWSNGPVIDENFKVRAQMFNDTFKGQYDLDLQLLPYDQYWPRIDLAYGSKTRMTSTSSMCRRMGITGQGCSPTSNRMSIWRRN